MRKRKRRGMFRRGERKRKAEGTVAPGCTWVCNKRRGEKVNREIEELDTEE